MTLLSPAIWLEERREAFLAIFAGTVDTQEQTAEVSRDRLPCCVWYHGDLVGRAP